MIVGTPPPPAITNVTNPAESFRIAAPVEPSVPKLVQVLPVIVYVPGVVIRMAWPPPPVKAQLLKMTGVVVLHQRLPAVTPETLTAQPEKLVLVLVVRLSLLAGTPLIVLLISVRPLTFKVR